MQGVGDGLGSTVQFAGGALGAGASQVGSMVTGGGKTETKDETDNALEALTEKVGGAGEQAKKTGESAVQEGQKGTEEASKKTSEAVGKAQESAKGST